MEVERWGMEKQKELSYDEAYRQLQAIAAEVNSGTLGVDKINTLLDEADGLVARCRELLYGVEKRVQQSVEAWKAAERKEGIAHE